MKYVFTGDAKRVVCRFRVGAAYAGCIGAECLNWWEIDINQGYCDKALEETGAARIYKQVEVCHACKI